MEGNECQPLPLILCDACMDHFWQDLANYPVGYISYIELEEFMGKV